MARLLASTLLLCLLASQASAQDSSDTEAQARQAFELGRRAYDDGRYEDAVRYYEDAHRLSGLPELLYNMGAANEHLGRRQEAIEQFTRFLEEMPDAQNRSEVEARLRVLRAAVASGAEAADEESTSEAASETHGGGEGEGPPAPSSGPGVGPWIVGGLGLAVVGAGIAFLVVANDAALTVTNSAPGTQYWTDVADDADRASLFSVLGGVSLAVGGAATAAAAIWLAVGMSGGDEAVAILPLPGGLAVSGRF